MQSSENLLRPSFAEIREINTTNSEIVLEPLERGFGHTLGNALRRILLSSIQGAAVVSVKIDDVLHEYATIEGVHEDVIDILLNIKELSVRFYDIEEAILKINVKGPGVIKASDIVVAHNVEILNPELVIATITQDRELNMELKCSIGVGYETVAERKLKGMSKEVGEIHIDSFYSPISRVSYAIAQTRIGNRTDLDKLTIKLETNGTIEPREAICQAATILHQQLSAFVDIKELEEKRIDTNKISVDAKFLRPVEDLELTVRSANCLKNAEISYIGDLVIKTPDELMKISNFGRKSLVEIQELLEAENMTLGMTVEGWEAAQKSLSAEK